jgi:hypothetical protein
MMAGRPRSVSEFRPTTGAAVSIVYSGPILLTRARFSKIKLGECLVRRNLKKHVQGINVQLFKVLRLQKH